MNAYQELLKGVQWVLDNCTSYQVAKDLSINNRTVNRYQNGTSAIDNMSLETASKLYFYYLTKQKEIERMKKLKALYAEWRKVSEGMLVDGHDGTTDCGEQSAREDFSNFAGLKEVITFEEMAQLENSYVE